jgi:hypothetical protein
MVSQQDADGNPLAIAGHVYDWSYAEFHTMVLEKLLQAGNTYKLTIPYTGSMVTYPAGLWYGEYVGDTGRE